MDLINKTKIKSSTAFPFALFVLYALAHAWIFLLTGSVFWDDWVIRYMSPEELTDTFQQAGSMFNLVVYMHLFLRHIGSASTLILIFAITYGSGLMLYGVLRNNAILSEGEIRAVVIFYLLLPFNAARVVNIDFAYLLCNFLFFSAWYLMGTYRWISGALFLISFNTNSLLVFYALPMLDYMYKNNYLPLDKNWFDLLMKFNREIYLYASLPIFFYLVKIIYYKPYGRYAGYNEGFGFKKIFTALLAQINDLQNFEFNVIFALLMFAPVGLVVQFIIPHVYLEGKKSMQHVAAYCKTGIYITMVGCFPYWILGHVPTFVEWTSRHQLLMPFGISILLIGFISIFNRNIKIVLLTLFCSVFAGYWASVYFDLYVDWKKESKIIELLGNKDDLQFSNLIVINDEAKNFNAINREYRFYEWNGLFSQALGEQRYFVLEEKNVDKYKAGDYDKFFLKAYNAESHNRDVSFGATRVTIRDLNPDKKCSIFCLPNLSIDVEPYKIP